VIRKILKCCFIVVCLTSALNAEEIVIPLAEFEGSYSLEDNIRYLQIDLGTHITAVNAARMELAANITFGTGHGDGEWTPWDEWFDWQGGFSSLMPDPDPGFWMADFSYIEGRSVQLEEYTSLFDATWDFLLDGTGEIYLEFDPMASTGGIMVEPPFATVESAKLILDVLYEPVSSQESSWSHIKALLK
jgi:hypothetical protein